MDSQRVVIPKGLVNPHETTIIEIPQHLQHVPAVVAVRRGNDPGSFHDNYPSTYPADYGDVTIPDLPSCPALPDVKRESINDPSGMPKAKFTDWAQRNTNWRYENTEDQIAGPREESIDYSDSEHRKGFDPYVHTYQLTKVASPYKQLQPSQLSTPMGYVPSKESATDWRNKAEEFSYLKRRSPTELVAGQQPKTPSGNLDNTESMTEAGIKDVLEKMEYIELSKIQQDLREFQSARRKLIFDATNMAPPKLGGNRIPRIKKTYQQ